MKKNVGHLLNGSQINLVVTCAADCTFHHMTNSAKKFKFPRELRNSRQNKFGNLAMAIFAGFGNFKTFFVLWQRNISTWLYVPLTGHITI